MATPMHDSWRPISGAPGSPRRPTNWQTPAGRVQRHARLVDALPHVRRTLATLTAAATIWRYSCPNWRAKDTPPASMTVQRDLRTNHATGCCGHARKHKVSLCSPLPAWHSRNGASRQPATPTDAWSRRSGWNAGPSAVSTRASWCSTLRNARRHSHGCRQGLAGLKKTAELPTDSLQNSIENTKWRGRLPRIVPPA